MSFLRFLDASRKASGLPIERLVQTTFTSDDRRDRASSLKPSSQGSANKRPNDLRKSYSEAELIVHTPVQTPPRRKLLDLFAATPPPLPRRSNAPLAETGTTDRKRSMRRQPCVVDEELKVAIVTLNDASASKQRTPKRFMDIFSKNAEHTAPSSPSARAASTTELVSEGDEAEEVVWTVKKATRRCLRRIVADDDDSMQASLVVLEKELDMVEMLDKASPLELLEPNAEPEPEKESTTSQEEPIISLPPEQVPSQSSEVEEVNIQAIEAEQIIAPATPLRAPEDQTKKHPAVQSPSLIQLDSPLGQALEDPIWINEASWLEGGGEALEDDEAEDIKEQLAKRRKQLENKLFGNAAKRKRSAAWRDSWPSEMLPTRTKAESFRTKQEVFTKREAFAIPCQAVKREISTRENEAVHFKTPIETGRSSSSTSPAESERLQPTPEPAALPPTTQLDECPSHAPASCGLLKRKRRGATESFASREEADLEALLEADPGVTQSGFRTLRGLPSQDVLRLAGQLERRFAVPLL